MSSLNNIVKSNKGYEIGHISHRKDGDYKKVGKGEWEKVEDEKAKKSESEKDLENSKEKTTTPNLNKYDQAYIDGLNNKELVDDVKNAIQKYRHTGNALLNQLYNNDRDLYNKLDKMGDDNAKAFINTIAYDKKYGVSKR